MSKSGIACYRSGGCGPYEMYSCSECPASKSDYLQHDPKPNQMTEHRMTNSMKLRIMSDEEQAEFMATLPCCPPGPDLEELCYPNDSCEGTDLKAKCWLNWLRQEAEE